MSDDAYRRFLRVMNEVHAIMASTQDIEAMLGALLQKMLELFGTDRAWLLYPCDPDAPSWRVPMEKTTPKWPGAFARNLEIPMEDGVRYVFQAALDSEHPVTFDSGSELQVPNPIRQEFGVRSQMILAVHPTTDRSWMLGMHHCETDHVFTVAEQELFEWIGRRLADSLSTLIVLRELRASEATLERRIRDRTAELERANEELESFSYSVSHDLKAPLRAVTGYTAALLDDCGEAVGTTGREYIRRMQASCEQMDTLIRSLLELSHVSRAEMTAVQSVDLSRHAEQAIAALRVLHPNREARVEIEPELVVEGDSALLRAAVANLIGNAWKYSAQKPVAEIRMRRLSAADEPMTLVIEDNGAGFDNRKAERIFQAFERLHPTSQFVGSGIGLATVRRVLDKHGATISADGQVGRGATFTIRFTA